MQMFSLALNRLCSIVKIYTKMRKILILRSLLHEQEGKGDKKGRFLIFMCLKVRFKIVRCDR